MTAQLHTVYTRPGIASCTRCAGPYTHGTTLIVTGRHGAGDHLCPPCARHTGPTGRRLADLAAADLRANLRTPPPRRRARHRAWRWQPDDPAHPSRGRMIES